MQININGVNLEFNLYDTVVIKKYDEAIESVREATRNLQGNEELSDYDKLEGMMLAIRYGFDKIFGDDIGASVCGATDMTLHMNSYKQLLTEAERQKEEFSKLSAEVASLQDVKQQPVKSDVMITGLPPISNEACKDKIGEIVLGAFVEHTN